MLYRILNLLITIKEKCIQITATWWYGELYLLSEVVERIR